MLAKKSVLEKKHGQGQPESIIPPGQSMLQWILSEAISTATDRVHCNVAPLLVLYATKLVSGKRSDV